MGAVLCGDPCRAPHGGPSPPFVLHRSSSALHRGEQLPCGSCLFPRRRFHGRNYWNKLPPLLEWDLGPPPLLPSLSPQFPSQILLTLSQRLSRSWQLSWWFDPNLHREVSEPLAVISFSSQRWHIHLYVCSRWSKGAPGRSPSSTCPPACASSDLS